MVVAKKYFPSQKTNERIFLLIRRHWITYIPLFAIITFMLIPLVILALYTVANLTQINPATVYIITVAGSIYALFVLSLFLFGFVDYYLDLDIVTNERVVDIEQNGFFHRTISELYLEQVEDVTADVKGIFSTLFNYGNVFIQTAGERENFVFKSIPRPYETAKTIIDLHEAALEGDGGIKKLINKLQELPGRMTDKNCAVKPQEEQNKTEALSEAIMPIPKEKEDKILSGIHADKNNATRGGTVTLNPGFSQEGEMHEGETVDI